MKIQLAHSYNDIICLDNLLSAWQEFIVGKKSKPDVQAFAYDLMDNIVALHEDLTNQTYQHGKYYSFFINDPKRRHIHKAQVKDRLLHHAVHRKLYPFFNQTFIHDSYSCRQGKGLHKAIDRLRAYAFQVSQNHTCTCWVLKCDIKKFFASVDHEVLLNIFEQHISDKNIMDLLENIIQSFHTPNQLNQGLPLGNLTSQLFINIYMNQFDQWVKHDLKAQHYIRYADDFVILSSDREYLENLVDKIKTYLIQELKLTLHPDKIFIQTIASGVDFLGWVQFIDHRVLRHNTSRRMFRRLRGNNSHETLQSYLGMLGHGNCWKLENMVQKEFANPAPDFSN